MSDIECKECGEETDTSDIVNLTISREDSEDYSAVDAEIQLCIDCWDRAVGRPIISRSSLSTGEPAIDPQAREPDRRPTVNNIIESISKDETGNRRKPVERATVVETAVYEYGYEPEKVEEELLKLRRKGETYCPEEHLVCST